MADLSDMVRDDMGRFFKNLSDIRPEERGAETARLFMIRRTRGGRDRYGNAFSPYRPRTIKQKQRKGQQVSPVNLTDSGNMLNRLQVRSSRGSMSFTVHGGRTRRVAEIVAGTREDERKLRFHITGTRYMARRDFFGLTPREEGSLANQFSADVARAAPSDRRQRVKLRFFAP